MIDVRGVSHTFDAGTPAAHAVLHDVTVQLSEHRIGIIGHNGSGKSTFVRMLDALIVPTRGSVIVDGADTAKQAAAVRRRTGFLFTDPDDQIIMPTVREDVAFGLRRLKLSRDEVDARVSAQLERFGLARCADRPAHLLSGGQKQVLALASVLITAPELLIMDEPTTLLDLRNQRMFADLITGLDQMVVLATHQLDQVAGFDRVLCFHEGRLVADGAPDEVVAAYRKLMDRPYGLDDL
ncbi:MAG: energy-coupling factor ABC transporter ATP-binding protein [Propionibacteriaceae bacterium]|nr:energy-coupling factor ABC transporter ATP-binding protein [Propionibacteriaceae bacterium]